MSAYYAGVDLGGTKIYAGLADGQGRLLSELKVPTEAASGYAAVLERVASAVREAIRRAGVPDGAPAVVGVGVPGQIDPATGVVHQAPNLGWKNVPFGEDLKSLVSGEIRLDNDANLAALGEYRFGAGRGVGDLVFMTVSTGIGGGLILNHRLYRGAGFGAGEIGHMVVEPGGPRCACGNHGCLEAVASGGAIGRRARELIAAGRGRRMLDLAGGVPDRVSARAVFQAAAEDDGEALELVRRAARYLGIGIANILNVLSPSLVILGGGVMESGPLIWELVRSEVGKNALDQSLASARLVPAALGGRMGLMGAVALAGAGDLQLTDG